MLVAWQESTDGSVAARLLSKNERQQPPFPLPTTCATLCAMPEPVCILYTTTDASDEPSCGFVVPTSDPYILVRTNIQPKALGFAHLPSANVHIVDHGGAAPSRAYPS